MCYKLTRERTFPDLGEQQQSLWQLLFDHRSESRKNILIPPYFRFRAYYLGVEVTITWLKNRTDLSLEINLEKEINRHGLERPAGQTVQQTNTLIPLGFVGFHYIYYLFMVKDLWVNSIECLPKTPRRLFIITLRELFKLFSPIDTYKSNSLHQSIHSGRRRRMRLDDDEHGAEAQKPQLICSEFNQELHTASQRHRRETDHGRCDDDDNESLRANR